MGEQSKEFKAIIADGSNPGSPLAKAEHISWLQWLFSLKAEAFAKKECAGIISLRGGKIGHSPKYSKRYELGFSIIILTHLGGLLGVTLVFF